MQITVRRIGERDAVCDAIVIPVTKDANDVAAIFGPEYARKLQRIFSKGFLTKPNDLFLAPAPDDFRAKALIFVGLGERETLTPERIRQAGGKALSHAREVGFGKIAVSTAAFDAPEREDSAAYFIEGALLGLYSFTTYRNDEEASSGITSIVVISPVTREFAERIRRVRTVTSAVCFARDLVNTPSGDMTPTHLAAAARSLGKGKVRVRVIGRREAERLGLRAYLAVAKGSKEQPKFIVVEYGPSRKRPVVLVGKSITFDSGGISLKPAEGMEKMKYDMAGGAAVLGVVKAAAELKMPAHLVGILPAAENMVGGGATRPGDVVRAFSGKTIEIVNTDAEGRLILADGISYGLKYRPQVIIDIATLTGTCSAALGHEAIALMGTSRELLDVMREAGDATYERVWEMPIYEEYGEYLKSQVADIKNVGNRIGALTTSAFFLKEFAGTSPWMHLDIAGTAWAEQDKPYMRKGATGVGVRLILEFIKRIAQ